MILGLWACAFAPDDPPRVSVDDSAIGGPVDTSPVHAVVPCPCPSAFDRTRLRPVVLGADRAVTYGDPRRDPLVVFLHGTGQEPSNHTRVLDTAAYAGYRVIAVSYASAPDMRAVCAGYPASEWAACSEAGHRAKIYGAESDEYVQISDEASIVGRLHATLTALHAQEPHGGWDAYFTPAAGIPDHERYLTWSRIVLAGFSQGAGHAAYLAREHAAEGVVLISGPPDPVDVVDWMRPGATPSCRWLAFRHEGEALSTMFAESWDLLGVEGADAPIGSVDGTCWDPWPPYADGRRFVAALPGNPGCASGDPLHGSMANDPCMNTADATQGDPYTLFRPYLYAFCRAGELTCTSP